MNQSFKKSLYKFSKKAITTNLNLPNFLSNKGSNVDNYNVNVMEKIEKLDYNYFLQEIPLVDSLIKLNEINFDINTKYGREMTKNKFDILTAISYKERSIEDHENYSTKICETHLYKVYNYHSYNFS